MHNEEETVDEEIGPHSYTYSQPTEYVKRDETSRLLAKEIYHSNYNNVSPRKLIITRPKDAPLKALWRKSITLILVCVAAILMCVARSCDFVLFVRMARMMKNYDIYLSSVLLASIFNVVYWPIVWFRMFVTKQITPEMRKFPWYRFVIMGFLDCIANTVQTLDATYVSGPINVVVGQMVILANLILSYIFLGSRYNAMHIGGVLIVLVGITVDVIPCFYSTGSSSPGQLPWIFILLLNSIPMAASNCYKEKHLKKANLDIWYVQGWVMFWQWVFGLIAFPIVFIPLPKPYRSLNIQALPSHIWNGAKCTVGISTLPGDECDFFYLVLLVFIIFNLMFNYLMLYVFKYGSSTLAVVAGAGRLALSNIGFLIPVLAGEATQTKLSFLDIEALVISIVGMIMYSSTKEQKMESYSLLQVFFALYRKMRRCLMGKRKFIEPEDESDDYIINSEPT